VITTNLKELLPTPSLKNTKKSFPYQSYLEKSNKPLLGTFKIKYGKNEYRVGHWFY
jgi:hypothetical protein